jgi:hypothetical protein
MSQAEIKKTVIVASHVTFARNKINNLNRKQEEEKESLPSDKFQLAWNQTLKTRLGNFSPLPSFAVS